MVSLVERLNVLMKLDRVVYIAIDYLKENDNLKISSIGVQDVASQSSSIFSTTSSSSTSTITESWRERICEWSYQVVDHFDFSREVVGLSLSFLDRFLGNQRVDKQLFQLLAMTTLYLAIKLNEPGKLSMKSMVELSRGFFTVEDMTNMELTVLQVLSWRVNPPTPYCFSKHLLSLLHIYGNQVDRVHLNSVMELSRFLTELSVIDYYFVTISASSVALASILNAMHILHLDDIQAEFRNQLRILDNFNPDCDEVNASRSRLGELFLQSGHYWSHLSTSSDMDRSDTESPICVTKYSAGIQIPKA